MPKVRYVPMDFRPASLALIEHANTIIAEYDAAGYQLTLRQLYYQFVSRDLIPNTTQSYKRLGDVVNNARLAGLIDWLAIEDRTRNLHKLADWERPSHIVDACSAQFRVDLWERQPYRVEVWIEKEALAGVFERVCDELRVPMFACRGYTSQSEMWSAAQRLRGYRRAGQQPVILHFGDHDPSGIDMTRDIVDRLHLFKAGVDVRRIALTMDQIREYGPPPNPAKETDSRFAGYLAEYGDESWELDALEPDVLAGLVQTEVEQFITEPVTMEERRLTEAEGREHLRRIVSRWDDVVAHLDTLGEEE